jgi:rubrerythrin
MEKKHIILTEDEFYEKFTMVKNTIDENASFDGCMFETYGEELELIQKTNHFAPKRVWTIVDCDGRLYYESGYHFVNRLGYFITEEDVPEDVEFTVELEDLTDGKYQCGSCEQHFDEPEDGSCPHCGSGNFVEGCIDDEERMEDEGDEHSIEEGN